ncbi:DUF4349 domain-containing protein [Rufibacter sediminis]|uniref:DUF4349 domain-containing protein n=1 Tax=Rufibacter sediminis TaxID=2762756 RepID=A0ABR6VM55_9BACT|nr:DUF4349 domain-containing protein [Rufibacter sediminis]MBC3538208.1 DUF4349 domain-containing protein [Rufibacter sediminis]
MKTLFSFLSLFLFCTASLLFSGCEGKQQEAMVQETATSQDAAQSTAPPDEAKPTAPEHVIRQAEVKFQVKDLFESTQRVELLVSDLGATLANTTQQQTDDAKTTDFVIRVQPEKFKPLMQQLQKESIQLDVRTISTEDVGMEYVDLQARKKAKLAVEQRFLGLLKEAKNMKQVLEVEREIQLVREEIESAEARLRYLQNQTAFSTIRLSMYQVIPTHVPQEPGFGSRLLAALDTGWQLWLSVVVGLFYVWPLWLLGAGVLLYLRKRNVA